MGVEFEDVRQGRKIIRQDKGAVIDMRLTVLTRTPKVNPQIELG